jgi:hypothetical protein
MTAYGATSPLALGFGRIAGYPTQGSDPGRAEGPVCSAIRLDTELAYVISSFIVVIHN